MFEWLENTPMARMVQESLWGYPIVLSSHAVGMAILAGIVLVINFRVMGLAPEISLSGLKTLARVAWVGLVINVISGVMLFSANAQHFVKSTPFLLKILFLVAGITLFVAMSRKLAPSAPGSVEESSAGSLRIMAWVSTVLWLGVIVMGRLIAYVDTGDF